MTYSLLLLQIGCPTKLNSLGPQIVGSATVDDGEGYRLNGDETCRETSARLRIGRYMIQHVKLIDTIEGRTGFVASKEATRRAV
jgi:hypothetical protein